MDGNIHNKVYINPNFKRPTLINNKFVYPYVPNLYQDFLQQMQNDILPVEENSSRRIYVNPNFKQVKVENESNSTSQEIYENGETMKSYPKLISKSKYSLVANVTKNKEINTYREDRQHNNINTMHKTDMYHQNIDTQKIQYDKYQKGVPIIKSRYAIVRKNNDLSNNKGENKIENIKKELSSNFKNLIKSSSVGTCDSDVSISRECITSENKPPDKIAKIKITKYKTVPITYLKKNLLANKAKELKLNSTVLKLCNNTAKCNKLEFSFNKDRYKLIRSSSKPLTNVNSSKAYIQAIIKNDPNKTKLLKTNFKVNNIPCRLFTKYGKCLRKDYGKCEYLHDKKHVSLCRKFLKGICHDNNCPLSHESTANKMPTCYFFLQGVCTKENCPYLHIKLNDKIKICPNFLRGYCEEGNTCKLRHVKGNQSKLSKIFNARNRLQNKSTKLRKGKTKSVQRKNVTCSDSKNIHLQNEDQNNVECRYYKEMVSNEGSCKNIKPTRCKIGTLPSFIQL